MAVPDVSRGTIRYRSSWSLVAASPSGRPRQQCTVHARNSRPRSTGRPARRPEASRWTQSSCRLQPRIPRRAAPGSSTSAVRHRNVPPGVCAQTAPVGAWITFHVKHAERPGRAARRCPLLTGGQPHRPEPSRLRCMWRGQRPSTRRPAPAAPMVRWPCASAPAQHRLDTVERSLGWDANPARVPLRARTLLLQHGQVDRGSHRSNRPQAQLAHPVDRPSPRILIGGLGHHQDAADLQERGGALRRDRRRTERAGDDDAHRSSELRIPAGELSARTDDSDRRSQATRLDSLLQQCTSPVGTVEEHDRASGPPVGENQPRKSAARSQVEHRARRPGAAQLVHDVAEAPGVPNLVRQGAVTEGAERPSTSDGRPQRGGLPG